MASGVPIVSTNVGGVPYVVEDGRTALLVRPRDPDAVVAAVERLVTDRALALRLRETGLEEVQRYRWANVRPVLWDVYARAVGRKPIGLHAA
jgi:glycosyltransferase involved in cell wall biosynthesis